MLDTSSLSEDAQDVVFMRHVFETVMLASLAPLYHWIGSTFSNLILICMVWFITRHTRLLRERAKAEIDAKPLDFQQYRFNCSFWFFWIKSIPIVVMAYVIASTWVWIYFGVMVSACAFEVVWEWSKLSDLKDRLAKQSTELT